MKSKRERLEALLKIAQREGIVPTNALIELGKYNTRDLIEEMVHIPELWEADKLSGMIPADQYPLFNARDRGAVPPTGGRKDIILTENGWDKRPSGRIIQTMGGGGHGGAGTPGPPGPAGPNNITLATTTNLTGLLAGNGATVVVAGANVDYTVPVNPSVIGNFVSFAGITGAQADSGYNAASFALAAHNHTGVYLRLDQTVQDTIINGAPIFNAGLISNDAISVYLDGTNAIQLRSALADYSQLAFGVITGAGGYTYIQSNAAGTGVVLPITFWVNSGVPAIRAMDITPLGRIGIGTNTPDTVLHVKVDNATPVLRLERNDATIGIDDIVARIEVEGQDAGAAGICAMLEAIGEGNAGETGWRISCGTAGSVTEVMRIDELGNVGIGVVDPDALLHLESVTGAVQRLTRKDITVTDDDIIGRIEFETQDTDAHGIAAFIQAEAEGSLGEVGLAFATGIGAGATERMRIDHHGVVTFTGAVTATGFTASGMAVAGYVVNAAGGLFSSVASIPMAGLVAGTAQYQVIVSGANPYPAGWSGYLLDGTTGGKTVFSVTNTKTLTLTSTGNFNLTVPATGTAALLATANVFTTQQMVDGTSNQIQLRVQGNSTQTTNLQTWENSSSGVLGSISGSGALTLAPTTFTDYTADYQTSNYDSITVNVNPASNNPFGHSYRAMLFSMIYTSNNVDTPIYVNSQQNFADVYGSGTVYEVSALNNQARYYGSGTASSVYGSISFAKNQAGGTVTNAACIYTRVMNYGVGTITRGIGLLIETNYKPSGTFVTEYGIYIENQNIAAASYAIYTKAGLNRFGDQVSVIGSADRIQLLIKAYSTQTTSAVEIQDSSAGVHNKFNIPGAAAAYENVFNETGSQYLDFRVESDNQANAIFLDASADTIAFGGTGSTGATVSNGGHLTLPDINFISSTPSALGGDVNDYDLGTNTWIRLSGGAADRIVTGIVARGDGHYMIITNIGTTNKITFSHESGSSSAANRIITATGSAVELHIYESIFLLYDATSSRWREVIHA